MMALAKSPNKLQGTVDANVWDKKWLIWKKVDGSNLETFPEPYVTENELRDDLTMDIHQSKQATSNTDKHCDENGHNN